MKTRDFHLINLAVLFTLLTSEKVARARDRSVEETAVPVFARLNQLIKSQGASKFLFPALWK